VRHAEYGAHREQQKLSTVSTTVAAALLTFVPAACREKMHSSHADEWQYWIKGQGDHDDLHTVPNAVTMDFNPATSATSRRISDIHKNTGDTRPAGPRSVRAPQFMDVSLSDWITHTRLRLWPALEREPGDHR